MAWMIQSPGKHDALQRHYYTDASLFADDVCAQTIGQANRWQFVNFKNATNLGLNSTPCEHVCLEIKLLA